MTIRPTKVPGFPKVPASVDPQTRQFLAALVEAVEIRLGRKGDPIDRAITLRELIESGLAKRLKETPFDPNNVGITPPGIAPIVIATQPYAPTNFSVNGAYSQINMSWDPPFYQGHNQTEIWSHTSDVLGDATMAGVATGFTFVDPVGSGVTKYYWVRFVNANGVLGPFNAAAGTVGVTAVDVDHLLGVLTGAITDGQLSQDLNSAIGANATAATSAAAAAASQSAAIAAKVAALLAQSGAETAESNAEPAETNAETALSNAQTAQTASSNSATSAAGSASSASTSATAAASSQTAAGNSASAASTSESNASTYATSAGTASTASQNASVTATTAKTNAETAETNAETAESNSADSASAASTSASNASASESAAGTSASAANTSATNAASSASSAGTYSTNAASSATAAGGSATAAASTVNGLTARLNNTGGTGVTVEQAYSANVSDIGDLEGQYTVKIDTNGAVAGFGLASTSTAAGNITSEFIVNADRFAIMRGGTDTSAATVPFTVQATATTINGESVPAGVYMADAFIKNGSIANAKIGNLNANKITAGTISADRIGSGSIDVNKLNLVGTGATINLKSANTGARMVIQGSNIAVYDSSGALRVKLGAL